VELGRDIPKASIDGPSLAKHARDYRAIDAAVTQHLFNRAGIAGRLYGTVIKCQSKKQEWQHWRQNKNDESLPGWHNAYCKA
jgi:phosphoserine phosphatase